MREEWSTEDLCRQARPAVLTVSRLHAGTKDNVIPDEAELGINLRAYSDEVRRRVIAAVERIIRAEATASAAARDPEIDWYLSSPALHSDPDATARTAAAFTERFGADRVLQRPPAMASEDVGHFGSHLGVPTVFWFWGGSDPTRFARAAAADGAQLNLPRVAH